MATLVLPPGSNSRKDVMAALWKMVSASSIFVTKDRKFKLWGDVPKEARPALFMHETDEDIKDGNYGPPGIVRMHAELFIYTNAADAPIPADLINDCIDVVQQSLAPDNMVITLNTLGGLVNQAFIEGKVFKDPGDLDGDGLAIIPVTIILPTSTLARSK